MTIWKRDDPMWEEARQWAAKDGVKLEEAANVIRDGNKVRVYMTSTRAPIQPGQIRGERGRRSHRLRHQHGRCRGPDARLHDHPLRGHDGDFTAADLLRHFHRRSAGRALVVLSVVLPCPAYGDVRAHARASAQSAEDDAQPAERCDLAAGGFAVLACSARSASCARPRSRLPAGDGLGEASPAPRPAIRLRLAPGVHRGSVVIGKPGLTLEGEPGAVVDGLGEGRTLWVTAPDVTIRDSDGARLRPAA